MKQITIRHCKICADYGFFQCNGVHHRMDKTIPDCIKPGSNIGIEGSKLEFGMPVEVWLARLATDVEQMRRARGV